MHVPDAVTMAIIKAFFNTLVKNAFFKDGSLDVRRSVITICVVTVGFAFYYLPDAIRFVHALVPAKFTSSNRSFVVQLNDKYILLLTKYLTVAVYLIFILAYAAVKAWARGDQVAAIHQTERNVVRFVKDVELINGYRCSNAEERQEGLRKIANLIARSPKTELMVINGYHDLAKDGSVVRGALEAKQRNLRLKVLLLDPFSAYARTRATQLMQETDVRLTILRYVRDHMRVIESLDRLKGGGGNVDYRIYCSNPFLRIYLFDQDLVFQTYQANRHGNGTPMYHFRDGERSFFGMGKEIIQYYWNKGFLHTEASLSKMGRPLTLYLAEMYGLEPKNTDSDEGLRERILVHVDKIKRDAEAEDRKGNLSND